MTRIVGLVTARGGSKGIPRKNVLPLAGKPLIAWTLEAALESRKLDRVIVSTDDAEIADVARAWGATVPFMRPAELARDDSSHIDVVQHALDWLAAHEHSEPEYLLTLQPTSPLRTSEDIDAAIAIAVERDAQAVVSVVNAGTHPFLAKRIMDDGTLEDLVPTSGGYLRRQVLPPAYGLNGAIYLNRSASLRNDGTFLPRGTVAYVMPAERSLDVDTPWDFYLADLILGERGRRAARSRT
jgi:CMP-N,N'-diacetyllegionaminic acid synthase